MIQELLVCYQERQSQALPTRNSQRVADGEALGLQRPVAAP